MVKAYRTYDKIVRSVLAQRVTAHYTCAPNPEDAYHNSSTPAAVCLEFPDALPIERIRKRPNNQAIMLDRGRM